MADEAETPDNEEELLLTDEVEQEEPDAEERDEDEEPDPNANDEADEEEVIGFADEAAKEDDTNLVKHLREQIRKRDKELADARKPRVKDAEAELAELGPRPVLESFDFDEDKHTDAVEEWAIAKARIQSRIEAEKKQTTQSSEAEAEAWEAERKRVADELAAINRPDTNDAFETVKAALTPEQQSALVMATEKGSTAKLIYALGQNPDRLALLAGEPNLIRFIKQVSQLEGKLTVTKRRVVPDPEQIERGSAKVSATRPSKELEKLEKEAERTGDRTKLIQFRKTLTPKAK